MNVGSSYVCSSIVVFVLSEGRHRRTRVRNHARTMEEREIMRDERLTMDEAINDFKGKAKMK